MHNTFFTDDLVWSGLQQTQNGPCYTSLYLPALAPISARIKFKTLMLAYRTATGSAPLYFPSLITISPQEVWDLRTSVTLWCHHREAQNHSPERFHSLFLAGGMNFPPPASGMLNPWQFLSNTWKLISSVITWLCLKKKNFTLFPFLCSLSLNLSLSG